MQKIVVNVENGREANDYRRMWDNSELLNNIHFPLFLDHNFRAILKGYKD